jgi:RNA-directed DNA polymerase
MKQAKNLIEKIAQTDNLHLAFLKAGKGKWQSVKVLDFQAKLDEKLFVMKSQILSGDVEVGNYNVFKIYEPKEREICSYSFQEKVLQHALMNKCHTKFDNFQIYDSYACRIGKGSHAAVKRAQQFSKKNDWYLKMDISKYFASIDHSILKKQISQKFREAKLLSVFEKIIDTYHSKENKGLPIGNLTSQYFANHYLAYLDHYIKEELKIKCYVRYMDDMVVWNNDKAVLKSWKNQIEDFLVCNLQLKLKPPLLNYCSRGMPFLGYKVFSENLQLTQRSKLRFIKKAKTIQNDYEQQKQTEKKCQQKSNSLFSFVQFANTLALRKSVLNKLKLNSNDN